MPIPAENIIATQDTVRNSGSSPSAPSGMAPYLLTASHRLYTTNRLAVSTKSQPMFVVTQPRAALEALTRLSVSTKPQTRNATATPEVTPKTTQSIGLRRCSSTPIG